MLEINYIEEEASWIISNSIQMKVNGLSQQERAHASYSLGCLHITMTLYGCHNDNVSCIP
jgi:hypothetical protein